MTRFSKQLSEQFPAEEKIVCVDLTRAKRMRRGLSLFSLAIIHEKFVLNLKKRGLLEA